MCPKASIRQELEKSREEELTKARKFEFSKIPSHALKIPATRQFEGSSERRTKISVVSLISMTIVVNPGPHVSHTERGLF